MKDEDVEKIAALVATKLKPPLHDESSDNELLEKLAAMLVEHRSPCHDFSKDDVHTLKNIIKKNLRLAKTKAALKLTVAGLIIREIWLFLKENLHWGQ